MKRFLMVLLCVLMTLCFTVSGIAESVCVCTCCQNKTDEQTEQEQVELTPEQKYTFWFDAAVEIIQAQWAHSTWIKAFQTKDDNGNYVDEDLSFLLNDDPFTWSERELLIKSKYNHEDSVNSLKRMYLFMQTAKPTLEIIKETHDTLEVPEQYKDVDTIAIGVIDTLVNYRDTIAKHIEEKTLVEFDKNKNKNFENPYTLN